MVRNASGRGYTYKSAEYISPEYHSIAWKYDGCYINTNPFHPAVTLTRQRDRGSKQGNHSKDTHAISAN
jgi:hypothetical protein